jgi:hypothetical protein
MTTDITYQGLAPIATATNLTNKSGIKFTMVASMTLKRLDFEQGNADCGTKCYLLDSAKSVLETANITSVGTKRTATFLNTSVCSAGSSYYVSIDDVGNAYKCNYNPTPSFPYDKTELTWIGSLNDGSDVTDKFFLVDNSAGCGLTFTTIEGTNIKVNIGDVFKDVSEIKTNIGDAWKAVTKVQVNIGDVWKTVFG